MQRIIMMLLVAALALAIATLHPFNLVMPWQGGEPGPVNAALSVIMDDTDFTPVEADWGRPTPFQYVRATATFEGDSDPALACSDLRLRVDNWGTVTDIERRNDGCDIAASGPGPMVAAITVTEDPEQRDRLRVDVRVEHRD